MHTKTLSSCFAILAVVPSSVLAAPIVTCDDQWKCLRFTYDSLPTNECTGESCDYQVCMILDFGGARCDKTGTVSHTCEKPDTGVCLNDGGFKGSSTEVGGISNGYTSCQTVPPGGVAEFLVKDGNGECGTLDLSLMGGVPLSCEAFGNQSCTGRGNIGKECVWRVEAPTSCGRNGGGGGDPHFKLWGRERYMYHGECDLVLVKSNVFADGLGLNLHLRTTIADFYSYVESAALRIGNDNLIVSGGKFWINAKEGSDEDLPTKLSGFTLHKPNVHGTHEIYQLDLNRGDKILFRTYKHFVTVDITGTLEDFGTSAGLLGDYTTGNMLARDGTTIITNPNIFGQEWQVQGDEPTLFLDNREPQHPLASCKMPTVAQPERNLLRDAKSSALFKSAQEACAGKSVHDIEFCIYDVMATDDVGMAGAW